MFENYELREMYRRFSWIAVAVAACVISGCSGGGGEVKLGTPVTYGYLDGNGNETTRFRITFERSYEDTSSPVVRFNLAGKPVHTADGGAGKGNKFVCIAAKVQNIGPRKESPISDLAYKTELEDDKGHMYPALWTMTEKGGKQEAEGFTGGIGHNMAPEQTASLVVYAEVPKEAKPARCSRRSRGIYDVFP